MRLGHNIADVVDAVGDRASATLSGPRQPAAIDSTRVAQLMTDQEWKRLGPYRESPSLKDQESVQDLINAKTFADIAYDDAANRLARAMLEVQGLHGDIQIVDPTPTPGNCHSFTFFGDTEEVLTVTSYESVIELWDQKTPIVVCYQNDQVAHTATLKEGRYLQTLIDGPVFSTPLSVLEAVYECFRLPDQITDLKRRHGEIEEANRKELVRDNLLRDLGYTMDEIETDKEENETWFSEVDALDAQKDAERIAEIADLFYESASYKIWIAGQQKAEEEENGTGSDSD
jgi:hypothetical protein